MAPCRLDPPIDPVFYCGLLSHLVWNSCYLAILCLIPYCSSEFLPDQVSYLIFGSGQWEGEYYHRMNDCSGFGKHCLDSPESLISSILLSPAASAVPYIPRLFVIQVLLLELLFLSGSLICWSTPASQYPVSLEAFGSLQVLGDNLIDSVQNRDHSVLREIQEEFCCPPGRFFTKLGIACLPINSLLRASTARFLSAPDAAFTTRSCSLVRRSAMAEEPSLDAEQSGCIDHTSSAQHTNSG